MHVISLMRLAQLVSIFRLPLLMPHKLLLQQAVFRATYL
jgi:hypothetical protein